MGWATRHSVPARTGAIDSEEAASHGSPIMVRVGKRAGYAIEISCAATALAAEAGPTAERPPRVLQVETKFLRLGSRRGWETA